MQKVKNSLGIFDDLGHLGMKKSELHLARLYINTIKLSITNALYIQFPGSGSRRAKFREKFNYKRERNPDPNPHKMNADPQPCFKA